MSLVSFDVKGAYNGVFKINCFRDCGQEACQRRLTAELKLLL